MINIQKIDENSQFTPEGERELLDKDPEEVRSFYALTGPARLEYAKQMAEAEAQRIRTIRKAQAEGIAYVLENLGVLRPCNHERALKARTHIYAPPRQFFDVRAGGLSPAVSLKLSEVIRCGKRVIRNSTNRLGVVSEPQHEGERADKLALRLTLKLLRHIRDAVEEITRPERVVHTAAQTVADLFCVWSGGRKQHAFAHVSHVTSG